MTEGDEVIDGAMEIDIEDVINQVKESESEFTKLSDEEDQLKQKLEEIKRKKAIAEAKHTQSFHLAEALGVIRDRLEDEDDEMFIDAIEQLIELAAANLKSGGAFTPSYLRTHSHSDSRRRPRTTTEVLNDNICYRVYKDEDEIVAFIGFSGSTADETFKLSQEWKKYILANELAVKVDSDRVRDQSPVTTAITKRGGLEFLHQLKLEIKGSDTSKLDAFENFDFSKLPPKEEDNGSKKNQIPEIRPKPESNGNGFKVGDKVKINESISFVKKDECVGKVAEVIDVIDDGAVKIKIPDVKGEHRAEVFKLEKV